jgi:hypothetical protein
VDLLAVINGVQGRALTIRFASIFSTPVQICSILSIVFELLCPYPPTAIDYNVGAKSATASVMAKVTTAIINLSKDHHQPLPSPLSP